MHTPERGDEGDSIIFLPDDTLTRRGHAVHSILEKKGGSMLKLGDSIMEEQCHGAPLCAHIELNPKSGSATMPQAWSREVLSQIVWFYNYPGAIAEAEYLGKEFPTIDQWVSMLTRIPGTALEKAKTLEMPLCGYYDSSRRKLQSVEESVLFWAYDTERQDTYHVNLKKANKTVDWDWHPGSDGLPLWFYKK